MTSTNYQIDWDNIGFGGTDSASSASYILRDSEGTVAGGNSTSTNYQVNSGYRQGVYDRIASFAVHVEDRSSQVAATAISSTTVTVSTAVGFSVGDFIAIIQNEGASQTAGIGKISNISSNNITVDFLSPSGVLLTIDGTNDYVYALDAESHGFGTLSSSAVTTAIMAWEVNADVHEGYGVYVYEDAELNFGAYEITDVGDGAVTAGQTEYGARSSDSTLTGSTFDTVDSAIGSGMSLVGSRSDNSYQSRDFLTLKVSVSSTQSSGSYIHNLFLIYAGDY